MPMPMIVSMVMPVRVGMMCVALPPLVSRFVLMEVLGRFAFHFLVRSASRLMTRVAAQAAP